MNGPSEYILNFVSSHFESSFALHGLWVAWHIGRSTLLKASTNLNNIEYEAIAMYVVISKSKQTLNSLTHSIVKFGENQTT